MKPQELFQSNHTAMVIETLHYVKKFCGHKMLVKIGGAPLQNPELVKDLCLDLSLMRACGISLVLVHGGGKAINEALEKHNLTWEFHEGQRVTTREMMGIIESVLSGDVNKRIVRHLNAENVKAVGLSGADARLMECTYLDPRLGEVGQVEKVNGELLETFLREQERSNQGYIPVVSSVGVLANGQPVNVNADIACIALAKALKIPKIIYMSDEDGILNSEGRIISEIDRSGLNLLIETGVVTGGMLTKVKTVLSALDDGIEQIHIINGSRSHSLIEEVFTNRGVGTVCQKNWEKLS
ncbi:MAG: acetylglutamate kinase [Bdellovibrionales bacterium]|nr:acetylglutamate kinase [Bdellovibrionales bacterium]